MQVVDDEHERLLEPLQLGQQSLDHRGAGEARRRADPLDDLVAGRAGERVDEVEPEPLRVTFLAIDRDPGHGLVRLRRPIAQKNRLPASRGCADERHRARSGR